MPFRDFLQWFLVAGAALLTYEIIELWPWAQRLPPKFKRVLAYLLSAGLACGGYLAVIAMRYAQAPVGWRGWVEALFAVGTGAFGLATLIHTKRL